MSRKFGVNSTRFTFTLNVDFAQLDSTLGCIPVTKSFGVILPKNTTKIGDIFGNSNTFTFLDPSKKTKRWILTMKDSIKDVALPVNLPEPTRCWWCHDTFTEHPLGCPSKYVTGTKETSYYSHANKKDMIVQSSTDQSYYLTKGYFCCWECLLAYAESVKLQPEYRECIQLVYHMFEASGGEGKIVPAPHFSLKQEYGGPLTAQEYKARHELYQVTGNDYIRMVPFGELYEVTSKF